MSETATAPDEHEAFESDFSPYFEGELLEARRKEVAEHLSSCARCRAAYDHFKETVDALSGLHRMAAPEKFEKEVEATIHRRSAGRFFGRRAFGDRVPFELLAVLALALAIGVYALWRRSDTGSVRPFDDRPHAPQLAPGAREVVPRP